jgi:hypothetical protein
MLVPLDLRAVVQLTKCGMLDKRIWDLIMSVREL